MGKGTFIGLLVVVVILGVIGWYFMMGAPAKCEAGQYFNGGTEECIVCKEGYVCDGDNMLECLGGHEPLKDEPGQSTC